MKGISKITGIVLAGAVALTACGGSSATVDGRQDDTKHVRAKTHTEQREVTSRKCTGTGSKRVCRDVVTGHRTVTVTDRAERWCVELDDVNGKRSHDDRWFTVTAGTYGDATKRNEGAKVKNMQYLSRGC